jgi:hypothetical protein
MPETKNPPVEPMKRRTVKVRPAVKAKPPFTVFGKGGMEWEPRAPSTFTTNNRPVNLVPAYTPIPCEPCHSECVHGRNETLLLSLIALMMFVAALLVR